MLELKTAGLAASEVQSLKVDPERSRLTAAQRAVDRLAVRQGGLDLGPWATEKGTRHPGMISRPQTGRAARRHAECLTDSAAVPWAAARAGCGRVVSMPDRLTRADVERIAVLAHLDLTPEEVELFTPQLADILQYAERLQGVDVSAAGEAWHPGGSDCPRRPDAVRPSLARDETLANAPDGVAADASETGGFFRVPRVLG